MTLLLFTSVLSFWWTLSYFQLGAIVNNVTICVLAYVSWCVSTRISTVYIPKSETAGFIFPSWILIICLLNQFILAFTSFNLSYIFCLPDSLEYILDTFLRFFFQFTNSSFSCVLSIVKSSTEFISIIKFSL